MHAPELEQLIKLLARLPGLGARSARRAALHLLRAPEKNLVPLVAALSRAAEVISECSQCGNLDSQNPCAICADARRDVARLCIVADVGDLWALERTGGHGGRYHVLGGLLSAMAGVGPDDLRIAPLLARLEGIEEIIFALPPSVEGQTTAHVVREHLAEAAPHMTITSLSVGIPIGGALEYLDEGTLRLALNARR